MSRAGTRQLTVAWVHAGNQSLLVRNPLQESGELLLLFF
jgi:hypothetical protein